jgi:hypothetical protein
MKTEKQYYHIGTNKISRRFYVINNVWNGIDQSFCYDNMLNWIWQWKQDQRHGLRIKFKYEN